MKLKKILASVLAAAITLTAIPQADAVDFTDKTKSGQQYDMFLSKDDIAVNGTNSLGEMLADELSVEAVKQENNLGYNIFSAEVVGNTVKVSFETLQDCTLIAAIYDNDNKEMLASGYINVSADEKKASVQIEGDIPQYFYIRAYLVSSDTMRPLCTEFATPMYTESMQEFLSKTVDDFDEDRVLNLDESKETNFAVFGEGVKLIPEVEGVNIIVSADSGTLTYVFDNADKNITSLKAGEIFSYKYEDQLLIVKVASVTTDGSRTTVKGQKVEVEEVFEHLRIDGESYSGDAEVDPSSCGEGVEYLGTVSNHENGTDVIDPDDTGISTCGLFDVDVDTGVQETFSYLFGVEESGEGKVGYLNGKYSLSAGLELNLEASIKIYFSLKLHLFSEDELEAYVECKVSYSLKVKAEIEGNVALKIPLMEFRLLPIWLVNIVITPSFVIELNGKVTVDGRLSGSVGFEATTAGIKDISESPSFSLNAEVEVTLFVGLSLEPKITLLELIAEAGLEAKAGVEVKAALSNINNSSRYDSDGNLHQCEWCVKGEINAKLSLSAEIQLIQSDILKFEINIAELSWHITDFYYSITYNDFGFAKTCPHIAYKTDITVYGHDNKPLAGATITADGDSDNILTTDSAGKTTAYLSNGNHTFVTTAKGYSDKNSSVPISGAKAEVIISFTASDKSNDSDNLSKKDSEIKKKNENSTKKGSSNPKDVGHNWDVYEEIEEIKVVQVAMGGHHSAAITFDGSLYMWGLNTDGELGIGTTMKCSYVPIKIMSNVASVSLDDYFSTAITNDGSLYIWGSNRYYDWETDTWGFHCEWEPVKIMDNVASVYTTESNVAAITKDGSLYIWGDNRCGQVGCGETEIYVYDPIKILDNVVSFKIDELSFCLAVTDDDSLYTWGWNDCGSLGNGTTENSSVPVKIMDNIASVTTERGISAAITTGGALYTWGDTYYDWETGTWENYCEPMKIMDNVKSINGTMAITEDGDLYMWGYDSNRRRLEVSEKILGNVAYGISGNISCAAITVDGDLYMWGHNNCGQLGNGECGRDAYIEKPIKIMENIDTVAFYCFNHATIALTRDGEVYAWGCNGDGQLGNGTTVDSYIPIKVEIPPVTVSDTDNSLNSQSLLYQTATSAAAGEEITFDSLLPNEIYNYYAVKSRTVSNILSKGNLLYIGQAVSDESGKLTLPSYVKGDVVFVKAMTEFDVYNPRVVAEEINAESVTLSWDGFENADKYEVYCFTTEGIKSVTEASKTSLVINGLEAGEYYGFLVTATVHGETSVPASNDILVLQTKEKTCILGDVNNDTKITTVDAKWVLQAVSGSRELTEEQKAAADVNGDGKITTVDAKWILQAVSGSRKLS